MKTKTAKKNRRSKERAITLDPIRKIPIPLELHEVESTIPCGFRVSWLEGNADGKEFDLASGAGCGSPYMMFHYDGRNYCVDMRVVVDQFIEAIHA